MSYCTLSKVTTFHTMSTDHENPSKEQLVDACRLGDYPVIGGWEFGRLVVRILQKAAVKYGPGMTTAEAATSSLRLQIC